MNAFLIALGVVTGVALAAFGSASWTNPTLNEDGSAFDAATEQAEVRIYCGIDPLTFVSEQPGQPQTLTPDHVSDGDANAASWTMQPAGDHQCYATVFSIYGYESKLSNVATINFKPTVGPAAITDFGDAS